MKKELLGTETATGDQMVETVEVSQGAPHLAEARCMRGFVFSSGRQTHCPRVDRGIGRQRLIGFSYFWFLFDAFVNASFHTREIVREGVGHLRSYRKSTE